MSEGEKKPTIDERLEALTMTVEHLSLEVEAVTKKVDTLATISDRHEREWQRFRRSMRAALETWLQDGDGEAPQG